MDDCLVDVNTKKNVRSQVVHGWLIGLAIKNRLLRMAKADSSSSRGRKISEIKAQDVAKTEQAKITVDPPG
ncbi:hypothetical protein RRG08_012635 [Elysia crispata]|uniref:Uncharacterized protein n=1 Tax=Elysia crispata TaxID=231223 RepID=A0AAE1DUE5_9GAST|nr:hypothetical protein RRG08_012635 [Elysia crispata]